LQHKKTQLTQYQKPVQSQVRTTKAASDAETEQVLLTKDNFKDMLLELLDKEHTTIIKDMLSQDFSTETN
jgi:hypothetical protein